MRLNHLHLHVTNLAHSQEFYEKYFGFVEHTKHGEIVFLRDAPDGLDLALAPADIADAFPEWFHFGFRLESDTAVQTLFTQMQDNACSVAPLERYDDFVFFRCSDPDGYVIEVYWEQ